ncbi:MAG: SDR family NAD(P)-dependent oxidoreductase [bacterium]|nr:SDR family NAD(P)-dependent oxidoreductase [bacterium]
MRYLITGGAGFIGINLADRLASLGREAVILDNLSRRGSEKNLAWFQQRHPGAEFHQCDVRDAASVDAAFRRYAPFDAVIHLAAQVAVTTSVTDPRNDFDINALGTFNVLEAARAADCAPAFIYASTNKVYGGMEHIGVVEQNGRYVYDGLPGGIDEDCPLDFHSPYGCSKGCADQYVRDYARIYGMRSVVFRQSAIYGPRQFGVEDQGWVAWFTIAACKNKPITIYGDGKQVRDLLWVGDLVDAYLAAVERIDAVKGRVFNVGGGPEKSISVWTEFGPMLERALGREVPVSWSDWRPGDQKVCMMNIDRARRDLGWTPKVGVEEGVERIVEWVKNNLDIID